MKGNLKKTLILFLVCALTLTSGVFNAALACAPTITYSYIDAPSGVVAPGANTGYNTNTQKLTLPTPPTVAGFNFLGWQCGNEWKKSGTIYAAGANFGKVTNNLHFVGKWELNKYSVSYEYEGTIPPGANLILPRGTFYEGPFAFKSTVYIGPYLWLPGYIFSGWSTSDVPAESLKGWYFTMPANNVVFKGHWTPVCNPPTLYPVSFTYADDGNTPDGAQQFATENYGGEKQLTLPTPAAVEGYTFIEWMLGSEGYQAGSNFGEVKEALDFVGYWHKNDTPVPPEPKPIPFERQNVSYAYTGAVPVGAPTAPELLWYLTPGSVKVMPVPKLEGYVFSGWSTQDAVVKEGVFLLSGKNVVFTGTWTAVGPSIVGVPKTGDEQAFLLPGALALAGIALIVTALCRRDKKRGR